jgi:hypothetical protein
MALSSRRRVLPSTRIKTRLLLPPTPDHRTTSLKVRWAKQFPRNGCWACLASACLVWCRSGCSAAKGTTEELHAGNSGIAWRIRRRLSDQFALSRNRKSMLQNGTLASAEAFPARRRGHRLDSNVGFCPADRDFVRPRFPQIFPQAGPGVWLNNPLETFPKLLAGA